MKHSQRPDHCDYCEEPVYSLCTGISPQPMFLCEAHYQTANEVIPAPVPDEAPTEATT
jgi:hypothetical protein